MDSGTAAIIVAVIAAVPGALAFLASRRKDDGDVSLRRDDAAWERLQATLDRQDADLETLRSDLYRVQEHFKEAAEHAEHCDHALAQARDEIADLRRLLDEGPTP